jgi:hypothetical protein
MIRRDFEDGSGDLVFEESIQVQNGTRTRSTVGVLGHGFLGIDNVREVEELVRKALLSEDG